MENNDEWFIDILNGDFQNKYIMGNIIGRGSTSTIHSCLYKGKKKYACKIIPKNKLKKLETQERIQILLRLNHENIVTVKETYDDAFGVYIIEDLAHGGELLERLASRGGYSERDAAKSIHDAVKALEYIHSMKIFHGNLRPEKLLYATEDENSPLQLTDIGVTTTSMSPYKILYCAPEVIATSEAQLASDIWSLGIVLYIMLCGVEPFRNADEMFPSPYWDDKTIAAKNLLACMMQKSPEKRPTARELLKDSWICCERTSEYSMTDAVHRLREFNARRKFKAATLAVRATRRAIAMSHCHEEIRS
ncbi:hypothetical protein PV327_003856 [Microctonus hyperodae]|uniref:Protein kinase domain-containing protein n=1 Tax=Microctonus hyperodae TaxID=165561 RepID=A0AA39L1B3_MICHY|nr:hypothetical protein PV327_003856 [Microctonus hyperodae]